MEYVVPVDEMVLQRAADMDGDQQQKTENQPPVHPLRDRLDAPAHAQL
jgi:hypothetical protein